MANTATGVNRAIKVFKKQMAPRKQTKKKSHLVSHFTF